MLPRREELIERRASVEGDLFSLAEEAGRAEARWNRSRKQRISLRVDTEVIDWFWEFSRRLNAYSGACSFGMG